LLEYDALHEAAAKGMALTLLGQSTEVLWVGFHLERRTAGLRWPMEAGFVPNFRSRGSVARHSDRAYRHPAFG